ncbi:MAG: TetR/AcrR family transcriptional regulator [Spirochaetaceae bacterium]|nr:TetR/AcrR family transcriptional regulator [Spirochaetaceae bacterium]
MDEKITAFKAERLEDLYKATLKVLARSGYKHARIEDVALEADMSKGNIYFYAIDKEGLFHNAIDWILNKWYDAITAPGPEPLSVIERFRMMARNSFIFLDSHKELLTILKANPTILSIDSNDDHFSEASDKVRTAVRQLVEEGVASGELKSSLDIEATTEFFFTTQLLYLTKAFTLDDEHAVRFFKTGIDISMSGIAAS